MAEHARPMCERELIQIVERASTLAERLSAGFVPTEGEASEEVVNSRLDAWSQAVAQGDWARFRKRLAWDGLDVDALRRALGPVRLPQGAPLPRWAGLLREAVDLAMSAPADTEDSTADASRVLLPEWAEVLTEAVSPEVSTPADAEDGRAGSERFLKPEEPLPFEEILAPFVLVARRRLVASAGDSYPLLSEEAHAALERGLLESLARYAAPTLHLEFSLVRQREQGPLGHLFAPPLDDDDRALYRRFVQDLRRGRLVHFFQEYAVLARLLSTITHLWVEATAEFLQRLAADRSEIQRVFGGDEELGRVVAARPGLSDPHRGRRSVIALTFASGRKLVYKPKDLGMEEAYARLLAWLNEQGAPLPFKVLGVLHRSAYGWVEFVEHAPCADEEAARLYYRRAGMLLCLVYALEGTDCHLENIIACGEHPVLIDTETLLHHRPRLPGLDEEESAPFVAGEQLGYSVLRTGLLPAWEVRENQQRAFDLGGLSSSGAREIPFRAPRWVYVNTDRMALEYERKKIEAGANVPLLDGVPLGVDEYVEEVVDGFEQMYRFLMARRDALLAPGSPLHGLAGERVRFVYRATRVYGAILAQLRNPKYLRDGVDRSIHLELLGRDRIVFEEKPVWWPVLAAEQRAMEQIDIPLFTARADSDALEVAPEETIAGCFLEPSFDRVLGRLRALGDDDLEQQAALTREVLYTYLARGAPSVEATSADADLGALEPLGGEELVARAVAIAEELRERAIRAPDGSVTWIAPRYLIQADRYQLQPVDFGLYDGAGGIALFLAALERATGGSGFRELTLATLQPLRRALQDPDDSRRAARRLGIGGASGLGSVVYALVRIAHYLDDGTLLEDARRAAGLITRERIADDRSLDIVAGSAGAILGLLALHETCAEPAVLERAVACGRHLLDSRVASAAGHRAWPTLNGSLLTGFSHGAAGIAYALLRLYEATGEAAFREAAVEAIAYERSVFVPEAGNWPDFRQPDGEQPAFMTSWCHGAPGIGLARLGGLPALDTAEIRQEIDIAVATTQRSGLQDVDQLCCGNLGRSEVLLVAGSRLSLPALRGAARSQAARVVTRAEQVGAFFLNPWLPKDVYSPAFFQGTAGIGYELLRLARPDVAPSVLLWE